MGHVEHCLATPQQRAFPISQVEACIHDGNLSFVQGPSATFPGVLVLAGIELIFFIVASVGLCLALC